MMGFEQFDALVDAIIAQGYSEDDAAHYASLIGDTPQIDADGRWLVVESDGRVLAHLDPLDKED